LGGLNYARNTTPHLDRAFADKLVAQEPRDKASGEVASTNCERKPKVKVTTMARLFSYTIPIDDGAAPNPFNGFCTLTICKPAIRRVARKGDWIAGLGSKNAPSGDLTGC